MTATATSRVAARRGRSTTNGRVQWIVLAAALVIVAATVVTWALQRAGHRVEVVAVARPIAAGTAIRAEDLVVVDVGADPSARGLVVAAAAPRVVGRTAAVTLRPGVLLSVGMWLDDDGLAPDERSVGLVLHAGRAPSGLAVGDHARAVALAGGAADATTGTVPPATDAGPIGGPAPSTDPGATVVVSTAASSSTDALGSTSSDEIDVRVLSVKALDSGDVRITVAVRADLAARLARLGARDLVVLIGVPVGATETTSGTSDPTTTTLAGVAP
jgi:hypothetical protein